MTNRQFQKYLQQFPDNMPVRLLTNSSASVRGYTRQQPVEFESDHMMITSEGAWIDDEAPPNAWDTEDGKIRHKGKRYILFNPIIH